MGVRKVAVVIHAVGRPLPPPPQPPLQLVIGGGLPESLAHTWRRGGGGAWGGHARLGLPLFPKGQPAHLETVCPALQPGPGVPIVPEGLPPPWPALRWEPVGCRLSLEPPHEPRLMRCCVGNSPLCRDHGDSPLGASELQPLPPLGHLAT